LKRLHMPLLGAAAAAAQDTSQLRRYSSGGYLQTSIDLASLARSSGGLGALAAPGTNTGGSSSSTGRVAAINTGGSISNSNDKLASYSHMLGQTARGSGGAGFGGIAASPYDSAPASARGANGRRRHHTGHSRQKGMPGVWL
jgi:hypothetical protein